MRNQDSAVVTESPIGLRNTNHRARMNRTCAVAKKYDETKWQLTILEVVEKHIHFEPIFIKINNIIKYL